MLAVIFKAEINQLDNEYYATAKRLRKLAFEQYGCTGFNSSSEGGQELAISYWPSAEHIKAWKADPEHQQARQTGRRKWYRSWQVEVVQVLRQYSSD